MNRDLSDMLPLPVSWSKRTLADIRRLLLGWFQMNRRKLPWRANRDPYAIWVSEVMLQQTTVAAVVPFFERFMARFPTVAALAAADEQDVLKLWAGLGYYRRARHLHEAARRIVANHRGILPDDPELWAALPGVGRYILGAVLSQAFDRRLPIVEANSQRVLARLFGYTGNIREGAGKKWVWEAAELLLPRKQAGDFNQALMELGALICTPTAPRCESCPLRRICEANQLGLQETIPLRPPAKIVTPVREVAVVIRQEDSWLLCQRGPGASRWANMWEVPHGEVLAGEADADAAVRIARELVGLAIVPGGELATIRHTVTRYAITMTCLKARQTAGQFASQLYQDARWITRSQLADYPLSAPQRRLMNVLERET